MKTSNITPWYLLIRKTRVMTFLYSWKAVQLHSNFWVYTVEWNWMSFAVCIGQNISWTLWTQLTTLKAQNPTWLTKWKQFHFIWIGNYRGICLNFIVKRNPHPTQAIKINFQHTYTPNEISQYMCIHEFTHPIVLNGFNGYHSYIAKVTARHMTQDNYKIIHGFL
jgi:hypothetical protein